jgi:RND family efflux transporter MFP subunit
MKRFLKYFVTILAVSAAAGAAWIYLRTYLENPWTRDAQVRADIVGIAARVSGPMTRLPVRDNQRVSKGDLLFEIDPTLYRLSVDTARADLAKARFGLQLKRDEQARRKKLAADDFVSKEYYEIYRTEYEEAVAEVARAEAVLREAEKRLEYTRVYAPVDGYVTGLEIAEGTYVRDGDSLFALIDLHSFWVAAYFKETRLKHIRMGDRAEVRFMGDRFQVWEGVVESIGHGIETEDGSLDNLLPVVRPTLEWVRLAQRFPVRVRLTASERLPVFRQGQTATVIILQNPGTPAGPGGRSF